MLTFTDDLARKIWEEHFDGLNADYGPKFCKRIVETVLRFNISSYGGIVTIGDVLEMWENGELTVDDDDYDDDDYDDDDCNGPVAYLGVPKG